jgi:hypothetical protein
MIRNLYYLQNYDSINNYGNSLGRSPSGLFLILTPSHIKQNPTAIARRYPKERFWLERIALLNSL